MEIAKLRVECGPAIDVGEVVAAAAAVAEMGGGRGTEELEWVLGGMSSF